MQKIMKDKQVQDVIIIGGGVMGLMTAYFASNFVKNIIILEKRTTDNKNKEAASFSYTRSIRVDYLDSFYARLAYESQTLWLELEQKASKQFFVKCGCLNLAKKSVTPNIAKTYGEESYVNINNLNLQPEKFTKKELQKRFPQFTADFGYLDTKGGFMFLPEINKFLLRQLKKNNVTIIENITTTAVEEKNGKVFITTDKGILETKKLVITAGKGTNDVMQILKKNKLFFPITLDKPQEKKYFYPPKEIVNQFLPKNFPIFAYLDVGIYGHPIFDKKKGAVKIGYFNPSDVTKKKTSIKSVADFVNECLPILKNVRSEDVTDADQCSYDMVGDDNFILGKLPKFENIIVGTGWRGTGYKFAPLVGKILSQLALQNETVYSIKKFSPERFATK
jgi:N-methyl-L-tryptophan oxidase